MGEFSQLIRELGTGKIIALSAVILTMIGAFILLSSKIANGNFVPIYNQLEQADAAEIVEELDRRNIRYQIGANGSQILVPEDQMLRLRLEMAKMGIPQHGSVVGYEIFDKGESLGTSNFIQNVNLLRALEGELARTISSINEIDSARVHLVVPKKELFQRDKQAPTASIVIKMRGGKKLGKQEISAIANLVATAVPGLDLNKITVIDNHGRVLKTGSNNPEDPASFSSNSDEYKANFENRLSVMIEDMLSRSLGEGKVKANVHAELNFDRIVTNSEIYDPDGQVVRSVQSRLEEEANQGEGGESVSIDQNLPDANQSQAGGGAKSSVIRNDEVTNYEISKKIVNHISETGTVKKLSIAVLVDGNYAKNPETGLHEYQPRSPEEIAKIQSLVKSAVGYDEVRNDKIEVVNMQFITDLGIFAEETTTEWFKRELPSLVQSIVIGIVVVLVLLFVVRPIAIRAFELHKYEEEEFNDNEFSDIEKAVSATLREQAEADLKTASNDNESEVDVDIMGKKFKSGSVKTINDFAAKYPEATVSIVRGWLSKD